MPIKPLRFPKLSFTRFGNTTGSFRVRDLSDTCFDLEAIRRNVRMKKKFMA